MPIIAEAIALRCIREDIQFLNTVTKLQNGYSKRMRGGLQRYYAQGEFGREGEMRGRAKADFLEFARNLGLPSEGLEIFA